MREAKTCATAWYDLSGLRARQIRLEDFIEFDLILAMDHENFDDIQSLMSKAVRQFGAEQIRAKIALMSEHDPYFNQQAVPDPYYGGADGFDRVLDQCESNSQAWINILKKQMQAG